MPLQQINYINPMEVYRSKSTLIIANPNGPSQLVNIISGVTKKYDFYEITLHLNQGEKITTFYKYYDIIVYHTTNKRIIATSLRKIPYGCLYRLPEGELSEEYDVIPFSQPPQSRVLAENVEAAICGDDYIVYYDGTGFCMICDGTRTKAEMMYLIPQYEYNFHDLCRKRVVVPFDPTSTKVQANNKYGEDHINFMIYTTPTTQHVLVAAKGNRSLECYYVHTHIPLSKDNLIVKTIYPDCKYKIRIQMVIYHEQKVYIYIPELQALHLLEGTPLPSALQGDVVIMEQDNTLTYYPSEQNFIDKPIVITNKYRHFMTCEGIMLCKTVDGALKKIILVNTNDLSEFDEDDFHKANQDTYMINKRDRFVEVTEYFIFLADVHGNLTFYSMQHIGTLDNIVWDNWFYMYKVPLFSECKHDFRQARITGMTQIREHILLLVDHGELIFVVKIDMCNESYKLTLHIIDFKGRLGIVDHSNICYTTKHSRDHIRFKIVDKDQYYLRDTLNFTRYCTSQEEVSVVLMSEKKGVKKMIAQGDGVTRSFMTKACTELSNLYFEPSHVWPRLSLTILNQSRQGLINIGAMLHMVILHNPGPLNIRLPLVLVEAIKGAPIELVEFEVFARIHYPETFHHLYPYRDNPSDFHNLQTGYASYEEALKSMCGYPSDPMECAKLQYACAVIKEGFMGYYPISNLHLMNIVTLNYYLSGDVRIDREKLFENMIFTLHVTLTDNKKMYKDKVHEIINTVTESDLRNLMINWSGSSSLNKSYVVNVTVATNFKFHCCTFTVDIPHICFEDGVNLKELLVTPMEVIVD